MLEQSLENGQKSTTLVPIGLYKVTHKKNYAPVPKVVQNSDSRRKLEQSFENGQ